jgi:hypothetical protein
VAATASSPRLPPVRRSAPVNTSPSHGPSTNRLYRRECSSFQKIIAESHRDSPERRDRFWETKDESMIPSLVSPRGCIAGCCVVMLKIRAMKTRRKTLDDRGE